MKKLFLAMAGLFFIILLITIKKEKDYILIIDGTEDIPSYFSVLVDGERQDSFPAKGTGYSYLGVECENGSTGSFDSVNWKLSINFSSSDACIVHFKKTPATTMASQLLSVSNSTLYTDTEGNRRFTTASPNNYVLYNCDDFNNPTTDTCELWRIIGVYKSVSNGSVSESRVKIMRADSIGGYSWDNKNTTTGAESDGGLGIWSSSSMVTLLNDLYFNRKTSTCGVGQNNLVGDCDFSTTGLKENAKALIEPAVWRLGTYITVDGVASNFLTYEINGYTYNSRPSSWTGHVGLMSASDYVYAVSSSYYNTSVGSYGSGAASTNWIYVANKPQWTISAYSGNTHNVWFVQNNGSLDHYRAYMNLDVRPVVYLKSVVTISGGSGTPQVPYQIK